MFADPINAAQTFRFFGFRSGGIIFKLCKRNPGLQQAKGHVRFVAFYFNQFAAGSGFAHAYQMARQQIRCLQQRLNHRLNFFHRLDRSRFYTLGLDFLPCFKAAFLVGLAFAYQPYGQFNFTVGAFEEFARIGLGCFKIGFPPGFYFLFELAVFNC